jgi:aldose 1-epimerase
MTAPHSAFPPPSGEQYELRGGPYHAVVTEVGATLRMLAFDSFDLIDGFDVTEPSAAGRGQVLAPWPNRLGDGRYTFEGHEGQAGLDEPERRNAIHGLVRWLGWRPMSHAENVVALSCVLHPQPAYPWRLELRIEYHLDADGLTVSTEATNLSETTAPFGIGFHPYLTVGTPTVDSALLLVPARRRLLADERGLPEGDVAVSGTEQDFTTQRPIGAMKLDTAYTELVRDDDGRSVAHLRPPAGSRRRGLTLWVDGAYRYLMVFTGDTLAPASRRRRSVAIEPMTCPPDALRSGVHVIRLAPGSMWSGRWGISTH